MLALNNSHMALSVSSFIGMVSVIVLVGLTLAAIAVALVKELEAKKRYQASRRP